MHHGIPFLGMVFREMKKGLKLNEKVMKKGWKLDEKQMNKDAKLKKRMNTE